MKQTLTLICIAFLFSLPAAAQSKDDRDKNADRAQIVGAGEILKIDSKKKTLQVRDLVPASQGSRSGSSGTRRSGGGGGGGGRRGGGGGGGRGGGGGFPGGRTGTGGVPYPDGSGTNNQAKDYKVFVSNQTALKFAGVDIDFTQLHVVITLWFPEPPRELKGISMPQPLRETDPSSTSHG